MSDDRGSKHQKHLYELCCTLYGFSNVIYEYLIPDLNLRIDIFIKHLGIAIEYHGIQHFRHVEFFHKSVSDYVASAKRDVVKADWIADNGIKFIELSGDCMDYDVEHLKLIIDSKPYPENYSIPDSPKYNSDILETAKKYRQEQYKKLKMQRR